MGTFDIRMIKKVAI